MNTKSSFVLNRMLKTPIKLNLDGILYLSALQVVVAILNILNIEFCRRLLNDLLSAPQKILLNSCRSTMRFTSSAYHKHPDNTHASR